VLQGWKKRTIVSLDYSTRALVVLLYLNPILFATGGLTPQSGAAKWWRHFWNKNGDSF